MKVKVGNERVPQGLFKKTVVVEIYDTMPRPYESAV